jgi:uncharacterized protein (TIGR00645 family)
MKKTEHFLEMLIFNCRWLLAPFYVGLIIGILMLLVKFTQEFIHTLPSLFSLTGHEVTLAILSLVDMSLIANLLIIIIFSGYENFVSKIDTGDDEDRPGWMGTVDFSGLKLKLVASIVAISAIALLKAFMELAEGKDISDRQLAWLVGIHLVFVISGVLLAAMDWLAARSGKSGHG